MAVGRNPAICGGEVNNGTLIRSDDLNKHKNEEDNHNNSSCLGDYRRQL